MPTLNYDNPQVRQYVIDVALHWMDPLGNGDFSAGVDGYRCDDAVGPPQDFWAQLRAAMTAKNPQSLLLGELWLPAPKTIAPYLQGSEFDAAFDFPLYSALGGNPDQNGDGALAGNTPQLAAGFLRAGLKQYPPDSYIVRFINNHDTNRVMSDVNGDAARARAGAVFELTAPGVPMIYYGEELGMKGEKGGPPWYDAYRREPLPWYASLQGQGQTTWFKPTDKDYNQPNSGVSVQEEDKQAASLLTLYRTLGHLRMLHPAFMSGNVDLPVLPGSESNLYELRVWDGSELFVVLINFSTQPIDWTPASDWAAGGTTYTPITTPLMMQGTQQKAGGAAWTLQAAGYAIFLANAP